MHTTSYHDVRVKVKVFLDSSHPAQAAANHIAAFDVGML
jgi:hypothetical protein